MIGADVIILGAGIAGASIAAELAIDRDVLLIEMEDRPGRHATGRSAATFAQNYGNPTVRGLTRASRSFFENPPDGFGDDPLLRHRGALFVADAGRVERLDTMLMSSGVQGGLVRLDDREVIRRCPILKPEWVAGGVADDSVFDLDVSRIHQGYLRRARAAGTSILVNVELTRISRQWGQWYLVSTTGEQFSAPVLVNAAGAWADEVARAAGARPVGLKPLRRTCLLLPAPIVDGFWNWPMVIDVDERAYFKPESGQLLLSPANEDLSDPCDAVPDELDAAIAMDRFETMTHASAPRIMHRWAGLRSFVDDRSPVVGFDNGMAGFFWLAGQGGYGIQTAPALAKLAAALLRGEDIPAHVRAEGVSQGQLSPSRIR
jgi:D-arginine dehydrogenase